MDPRIGLSWEALPTPCLLVDLDRLEANVSRMAAAALAAGVQLRPHIKTHKIPDFARLQLASGAVGITVSKVSEAEVMFAGGLRDIFIAYPVIGPDKARRVVALLRQGCRIIVGVDSEAGARGLSAAAAAAGVTVEVRIEIDSGLHRAGVAPEQAADLARRVADFPGLKLEGIFTYRGATFPGSEGRSQAELGREEGERMAAVAAGLRAQGIAIDSVSAGSTPTGLHAGTVRGVTEIRPGTYVFNDNMQVALGVARPEDVALTVLATVVSRPDPGLATLDAGAKTFCGDLGPGGRLGLPGFATAFGRPEVYVERMNEEHGVVRLQGALDPQIGEKLRFIPNHVCTAVNLSSELIGIRAGRVENSWPIAARGMRE